MNKLIKVTSTSAIKPINKTVLIFDKSNFVTFPINANIPNNNDVTANTYIIDVISYFLLY